MGRIALTQPLLTPSTAATAHEDAVAAALCAHIRAGSEAAFTRLYESWFDRALAAARHFTGRDESFCLDVVQDAMMKAVTRLPALESAGALDAWMHAAVRTSAIDRLRSELRRAARERDSHSQGDARAHADEIEALTLALRALGEEDRELLAIRFAHSASLGVLASLVASTTNAVHGRIRRILSKIRNESEGDHA